MITSSQIRSARGAVGWSAKDLAERSGVGLRTILRLEQAEGVASVRTTTLIQIKKALEAAGIEFIGTPEEGPGIRLWRFPTDPQEIKD